MKEEEGSVITPLPADLLDEKLEGIVDPRSPMEYERIEENRLKEIRRKKGK